MSSPSCTDVCEIIHTGLRGLGFEISDDEDHTDMLEALAKCKLVIEHPEDKERVWPLWNLTEETIKAIAKEKGLALTGKDFDEIARQTRKGIDASLDFVWEKIVIGAIKNTKADWALEIASHELIDRSVFSSGGIHEHFETWKGEIDCKSGENKFFFDFEFTHRVTLDSSSNEVKITSPMPEEYFTEDEWVDLTDKMITFVEIAYKKEPWKEIS